MIQDIDCVDENGSQETSIKIKYIRYHGGHHIIQIGTCIFDNHYGNC